MDCKDRLAKIIFGFPNLGSNLLTLGAHLMILNHCFFLFSKKSSGQKKFSLSHWFEGKYAAANTQHRKLDSSGAVGLGGGGLVEARVVQGARNCCLNYQ